MDPTHLHQVVWNLCENAIRYGVDRSDPEPVELAIGRRRSNNRPYREVRDRGPGIPAGAQHRIFEPFFRADADGDAGSGLGLFISRELCEWNRAALLYEPRTGGGSVFRIIFADPLRWEP
jgi:two-component system sensor histidine kinase PilS (NtrC family)